MESLSDTIWDVIISGTGLPQSLLALAFSRSGKKVLHIDRNDYYGGAEAALSLQEVETWAESADKGAGPSPFRYATVRNLDQDAGPPPADQTQSRLGFSRAYSLTLSPQLIYSRSNLLPALVSSKVYRQLEFLAVGNWWLFGAHDRENSPNGDTAETGAKPLKGSLRRIPGGREDVFADKNIDLRSTRSLMKFLKLAADSEAHASILEDWGNKPFPEFLQSHLNIPPQLQAPLLALTLSPDTPAQTFTSYALPRIHRHLTSIGMFGPGFGSVIPKWGGLAEVAQVTCRAGAVGGGVYVLKKGFETCEDPDQQAFRREGTRLDDSTQLSTVRIEGGEEVKTRWIVGSVWDLPERIQEKPCDDVEPLYVARSITIVSGLLSQLFPSPTEGAPPPAGAVVVFPTGTLSLDSQDRTPATKTDPPPVYLAVHSSDTGECPLGQCVIYAHTFHHIYTDAHALLQSAVEQLLASINENSSPTILWYMHYDQKYTPTPTSDNWDANIKCSELANDNVLKLPDLAPGLALEDDVLKHVRAAYQIIMGTEGEGFMMFEDREGMAEEGDEGDGGAM